MRITEFVVIGGPAGTQLAGFEVKVNDSIRTPLQTAKDSLIMSPGGVVRSSAQPNFTQGMPVQYETDLMYVEMQMGP